MQELHFYYIDTLHEYIVTTNLTALGHLKKRGGCWQFFLTSENGLSLQHLMDLAHGCQIAAQQDEGANYTSFNLTATKGTKQ